MTDRALLEAAAKAAGLWDAENDCIDIPWSPLTDDGDALRLAVKLQLPFDRDGNVCLSIADGQVYEEQAQDFGGDFYAATRRAIVRAAAEIGRTMP